MLARAGCGGRAFSASRPERKVFRIRKSLRDMLAIIVNFAFCILNSYQLRRRLEYATGGNAER